MLGFLVDGERGAVEGDLLLGGGVTSFHVLFLTARKRPGPLPLLATDEVSVFMAAFI